MTYNFPLDHVQTLKLHCLEKGLSMPEMFRSASIEQLQACYNGVGPDRWSSRFRRFTTWILTFLEASALIHDWEYEYQPKTYLAFTVANLRLAWNASIDRHPVAGLTAAVLCQIFGWRGFLRIGTDRYGSSYAKATEDKGAGTEGVRREEKEDRGDER